MTCHGDHYCASCGAFVLCVTSDCRQPINAPCLRHRWEQQQAWALGVVTAAFCLPLLYVILPALWGWLR